jgi:serine/threonine-protein kinase
VPYGVAARIIGDAARGLHAAHELRTTQGEPAGVVHRDVSPQNVFVLYSGVTKVVDFGIARSEEREDATRTGELKGKFQYMAPEQINQDPLDRRADVFALGITLWELCSNGRKLFRRDRDLDTMLAVLNEPIPKLSTVREDCPESLQKIIDKALERERDGRFGTADEMARALSAFLSETGGTEADTVADWMRTLFEDRIAAREELLASTDAGRDTANIPIVEMESGSEADTPAPEDLAKRREAITLRPRPLVVGKELAPGAGAAAEAKASRRGTWIAIALGVVAVTAIAAWATYGGGGEGARESERESARESERASERESESERTGTGAVTEVAADSATTTITTPEPPPPATEPPATTVRAPRTGRTPRTGAATGTGTETGTGTTARPPPTSGSGPHIMTDFESIE